jgi:Ser/Thr protein kinase RdoA (MazF antagonist)
MDLAGPDAPPDPGAWQHPIWTAARAHADALALLDADRPRLAPTTAKRLEAAYAAIPVTLESLYRQLRFTHGDCHVGQFYVVSGGDGWQVTGFVDMEDASAGAPEYDLVKFTLEMMSQFSPETGWWQPLFARYGQKPDFEQFRLLLLTSSEASFKAHGEEHWPATREATLANLLAAQDWRTLFTKPEG